MKDFNSEEDVERIVKSAYRPTVPAPEFKEQLFERLTHEGTVLSAPRPIRERPKVWVPIAATIVSVVIGYGIWLSLAQPIH